MRKYVLGVALATTALASPAFARDNSWYLEGDAGVAIPNNQDVSVGGQHLATISSQLGYDLGAIVGYDFGLLRLEGERFRLTPHGRLISNDVFERFLGLECVSPR